MAIYTFEGRRPTIGKETFIADSAEVIGNVNIGEYCFIGPGVRLRGFGAAHSRADACALLHHDGIGWGL